MLINLRNALMSGKRLPYDEEVEYFESTGTQWIDTGVYGNSDTVAELTFAMTDNSRSDAGIFGSRKAYRDDCFCILRVQASSGAFWMHYGDEGTSANYISTVIGNTTDWHVARLAKSWSIDNSSGTAGNYTFTTPTTLKLFAADMSASSRWYAKCRVSRLRIYSNGVLVRDYIPVRKGTVGYFYDRVSGKLFGNDGTGDFVLGPDVVPVEYIESHGTEYIDTGVPARTGLATDIVCAITQAQNDTAVCGAKGTSNNRCVPVAFFSSDSTTALVYGNGNRNTDSIYAQYYPEVGRMVRYQSEISTGAISLNIDGTAYTRTMQTSTINAGTTLRMFAREWNGTISAYSKIRMASALFDLDGERVRKYLPVRVGTEGAMMDVLTRRIYRNAGTGAFTYGNDLRYPIPAS